MTDDWLYDEHHIAFLEEMWGDGYLSPGGPEEVARVLDGIDLTGLDVLDIGCGSGGITVDLVRRHDAGRVVGIDVEVPVCDHARRRVERAGVADRVDIRLVEPGPLPFDDGSFDVVFSKDSIVHIADKETMCRDVFRVLRPGGWFVASDWLIAHDGEPSPGDGRVHRRRGARLRDGVAGAIRAGARRRRVRRRRAARTATPGTARSPAPSSTRLTGPDHDRFVEMLGADEVAVQIRTWSAMVPVLESGEHCPHHFRARRAGLSARRRPRAVQAALPR